MHRSGAPYRCCLFKTDYSYGETEFDCTQTAEDVAQSVYVDTASCSTVGFGHLVESQEGLEIKIGPMADLVGAPGVCSLFRPVIWECGCLVIERSYNVWLVLTTRCRNLIPMTSFWDLDLVRRARLWHYFPAALETLMLVQASVLLKQ
ncbi:hypothetical protein M9H77_13736 [Catharanthus roseus]|uniref:Uncharacterized protein n=1 Tax=Catharanthus roseus TaxID=4058 RepID=A0ACC0BL04_CATRO|nr:hypothetical protein M9H77_13736 [Catharanthus roseus]